MRSKLDTRARLRGTATRLALVAAVAGTGPACDSPTELVGTAYDLTAVNGQMVPAPFPDPFLPPDTFEVVAGTLVLRPDGTFAQDLTIRCKTPQPVSSECQVEGDGRVRTEGHYSRTEGSVVVGGRQFPATFRLDEVTIDLVFPPGQGALMPRFLLEFHRTS
jgi:hypothetical protein